MGKWLVLRGLSTFQWLSFYLVLHLILLNRNIGTVVSDTVPPTTKYREVVSVTGSVGQIPCPVTSFDEVVMILWFKGSSGAPIYSYDARKEEVEPRHMTLKDDWGLRLYFRVWPNNRRSPALMIQELKPGDGGLYRCRVDYRNSPTTNAVTRLKIIEPPTRLEIRDTSASRPISDQQLSTGNKKHSDPTVTYMGPYSEGQNVTLVCSAYGGKPLPEVRWYKNGDIVDTSYSLSASEYTVNEMAITNLDRNHTFDIYSCQANNNNETQALTHKVLLEIYLGVTSVELEVPSPMTAGSEYTIVCKTTGAYPTVKVEFWKNLKRIVSGSQMKSLADNVTFTSVVYKPEVLDDGTTIKCIAENPWVTKKPSVARKTMKIKFIPIAVLRLGRNRTSAFTEGESVLMECHVKANPPAHTILWFHRGRQLGGGSNESAGITINGMTLFIRSLTYHVGGDYNCEAVNDVGKGISNTLPIELHLSPKCVTSEITQVPLAVGETNWLTCNILAWPSDLNFYWTLNRSENGNEHLRPISTSSMAGGIDLNVTFSSGEKSNSTIRKKEEKRKGTGMGLGFENQNGYPPLTSRSSSASLDYPEDQHMPFDVASKSGTGPSGSRNSQKYISFREKNGRSSYPTEETEISEKKDGKSMTHSYSDVVSTSTRNASPTSTEYNFDASRSRSSSNDGFSSTRTKLTSRSREPSGSRKTKRDVYENQQQYYHNHLSSSTMLNNREGRNRDATTTGTAAAGFQDKIRHTSLLSYQVRSEEDYGTVACWATNSLGSQVFPCLFHITKKEESTSESSSISAGSKKGEMSKSSSKKSMALNTSLKEDMRRFGNLTAPLRSSTAGIAASEEILSGLKSSSSSSSSTYSSKSGVGPQRGFSKLQKTLGIVLLLLLIFIAALAGLTFSLLFVLARRRREIQRIFITPGVSPASGSSSSKPRSRSRNNGIGFEHFLRAFAGKRRNSSGKGATVVNKNSSGCEPPPGSVISKDGVEMESDGEATAFPSSADVFLVSSPHSTEDPFGEIGKDTNKGKPQLSCISADIGANTLSQNNTVAVLSTNNTTIASLLPPTFYYPPGRNDETANNNTNTNTTTTTSSKEEKDIELRIHPAIIHCFSSPQKPGSGIGTSYPVQFAEEGETGMGEEGFKTMTRTRRAAELFGGCEYYSPPICNNDDVHGGGGEHNNHNQKSTSLSCFDESTTPHSSVEGSGVNETSKSCENCEIPSSPYL